MRDRLRGAAATSLVGLITMAGCGAPEGGSPSATPGSPASSAPVAAPSPTDRRCGDPELNDKQVTFATAAGAYLTGYLLGTGETALVLAAQASADSCSWLSFAKQQAAKGYRVLAFDFAGEGRSRRAPDTANTSSTNSGDVEAAAKYAREHGASRVVLLGASRGGTAVLVAAGRLTPPATAVISLSAPGSYEGESALDAVPRLTVPVLYLAARGDTNFATAARSLYDATPGTARQLVITPGGLHGHGFLVIAAEGASEGSAAIDAFLAAHAPPG